MSQDSGKESGPADKVRSFNLNMNYKPKDRTRGNWQNKGDQREDYLESGILGGEDRTFLSSNLFVMESKDA